MTTWALLAPGPSASSKGLEGLPLGVIGNAFELAPWADFIAASDSAWWRRYPKAMAIPKRYSMLQTPEVERVRIPQLGSTVNSGVLGLECAVRLGAKRILLVGFDMRGTHFFGAYENGLRNTQPHQRLQHLKQYEAWAKYRRAEVINCTEGSAIDCFPRKSLDACLAELALHGAGEAGSVRQRIPEARLSGGDRLSSFA